ncbi:MAG: hypothetical protein ABIA97_00730 [Candidatus Omnitrophota bacterium]
MNFSLIITGLVLILIGTLIAGVGWNWDKTKNKKETDSKTTIQASTLGNHSPAINIEQPTIILPPNNNTKLSDTPRDEPLKNFASRYTLAADMNILTDHVHVDGINMRNGNVNVADSEGVELKNMKIFKSEEESKGKINIDRSQDFSVKDNKVANEINIDRSKSFDIEKNTVGEIADRDKQAQKNMNVILLEISSSAEVLSSLMVIQKLISEDNMLANALGKRITILDKENNGKYKTIIINHLRRLNIDTPQKAETKNAGLFFHWLNSFMHFDEKESL